MWLLLVYSLRLCVCLILGACVLVLKGLRQVLSMLDFNEEGEAGLYISTFPPPQPSAFVGYMEPVDFTS